MTTAPIVIGELGIYACPGCKRLLRQEEEAFRCLYLLSCLPNQGEYP